jgi:hypothetical protein
MKVPARLAALLLLVALGGCASPRDLVSGAPSMQGRVEPVELEATPFFPQEDLQCGPAALATVLGAAGAPASPEQLASEVYTPGLDGSLQLELVAAARARGFVPYVLPPALDALWAELLAGRPVLVLQNLRLRSLPAWHYAVVVGADPAADEVVLRSGAERRLATPAGKFLRTWDLAERWGLVLLPPGELPAAPDRGRYFEAVAGLEAAGRHAEAARAWSAALDAWPGEPVALFGSRGRLRRLCGPAGPGARTRGRAQQPRPPAGRPRLSGGGTRAGAARPGRRGAGRRDRDGRAGHAGRVVG